ncbi:hypothetical protein [Actinoplanes teichomyceticus]|uniref:hypothetical protein n=1 Tax=Actinoplanes teichomyceticus TaxID=1867 RepID=UPI0011A12583|nr:hypothetical protein [Actinoplanes teichomyceticus]
MCIRLREPLLVVRIHPRVKRHVVVDNYATHNHPNVKAWPAKHPRITLHCYVVHLTVEQERGLRDVPGCPEAP